MSTPTIRHRVRRLGTLSAIGASLLIGATACAAAPQAQEPATSSQGTSQESLDKEFSAWQLKYADCMRDEGIPMSDPGPDGSFPDDDLGDPAAVEAAGATCLDKIGEPPASANAPEKGDITDFQLKLAGCLREAGYDVADPDAEGNFDLVDVPDAALQECGVGIGG